MSAVAFQLHLAASVLMVTTGLSMGSICAMSEGMHQIIDAAAHVASINGLLAAVWGRVATSPEEQLPFGTARLAVLAALIMIVFGTGGALFIALDAVLQIFVPDAHASHHDIHDHRHENTQAKGTSRDSAWVWLIAFASVAAAAFDGMLSSRVASRRVAPVHASVRCILLLLLGASIASQSATSASSVPPTTPPLLKFLLTALVRQPDALVAAILSMLCVSRGCTDAAPSSRLLLQMSPAAEIVPDMPQRLSRARSASDVLGLRDIRIWMVDEARATGSLTVVVRAGADTQRVLRHVKACVEGGAIADLVVFVDQDEDEDWGAGSGAATLGFTSGDDKNR